MRNICFMIIAGLLAVCAANAAPQPETIVVCYPGGSVTAQDANGAMSSMLRVAERIGRWPENSFDSLFAGTTDECRKQIAAKNPKFAIASLGLFLELHRQHSWVPVAQPRIKGRTNERYRVVVQKGKFTNLGELQGKTLGGTVLDEQAFIGKIVFAGQYDPEAFFVLKPSKQAIRALRALDKGELDAVILNQQQFDGMAALHLQTPLEAVFISEDIPLMGVVANNTAVTEEERARFSSALEGVCTDSEGKKLCELFGIESFAAVDAAVFEPMLQLWTKGK
ncbi:MAG: sterol transporter periplasmic substrate-binding protein BstB [Gammaproteobacteria bacterium]